MGVKVTRKMRDGTKNTREYVCFGFLAGQDPINADVVEMEYHFSHSFNRSDWGSPENYLKAMAEIIAGNPMFKPCKVHPRKGVVSVKNVETIPCDHLMACLFAVRNMAQNPRCINTYKWCREKGFSPIVSFTVSQIFVRKVRLGPLDREDRRWARWSQSESSMIHQATFGELAFKRMIRQGYSKREFNPWRQEPFTVQQRYLRDSTIHDQLGHESHILNSEGRLGRRDTEHVNYMSFCFTDFSGKEKPLHPTKSLREGMNDAEFISWLNSMLPKRFRVEETPAVESTPSPSDGTFRVGSRVRMTPSGARRYSSVANPNNTTSIGEITSMGSTRIQVRWIEEGYSNSYTEDDIQLV